MRLNHLAAAILGAGLALGSATLAAADENKPLDASSFVTKAAHGGLFEVDSSSLARERSQRADVKKFAELMVTDHTAANKELVTLAGQKSIAVPNDLGRPNQETLQRLMASQGEAFDREYVKAQVAAHNEAVKLFTAAARDLPDPELKAWAAKTLPKLKEHQKAALALMGTDKQP